MSSEARQRNPTFSCVVGLRFLTTFKNLTQPTSIMLNIKVFFLNLMTVTLAFRLRQNNGPTPTGDYQPSRSLSMAGSGGRVLKRRTSRKKYNTALVGFKGWCQKHCHLPKALLFAKLNRKLRGYWNYYGIRGNYQSMMDYYHHIKGILFKWLNRRSQKHSYNWTGFKELLKDFPLIKPHICHGF